MELKLTNEEIDAIKYYKNEAFENINQMLSCDARMDIAILTDEHNDEIELNYSKETVLKYLEVIKKVYTAILKSYYKKGRKQEWSFYKLLTISDVEKLKNEPYIDKFILANEKNFSNEKNILLGNNQIIVKFKGDANIPYVNLKDVIKSDEILISLFTKLKGIEQIAETKIKEKSVKTYCLSLEEQELQEMSSDDKVALCNYIISNSDLINSTLINSANLEKENISNYDEIRNLEKEVADLEVEINNKEIEGNYELSDKEKDNYKLKKLNEDLDKLKNRSAEIFDNIKNNNKVITDWKKNITVYLMAECSDIKKSLLDKMKIENEIELEKIQKYEFKERVKKENLAEEKYESIIGEVKEENQDNIMLTKKVIADINKLINRQQNFAKIAGSLDTTYSALNNAFEMKKNAEELEELLETVRLKIEAYAEFGESEENTEALLKVSEVNNQITILLNYLNNPKTVAIKQKINRFDEMIIVEENELKRNIAKTILDVRGEAELKKLRDDTQIIEEKSFISKIFGVFTGQNKLDEFILEQIEIRQNAINRTLSKKLRLDYNYSIHELLAEIRMFINENYDDDIVAEDILILKDLENQIKKNFVIIESKVKDLMEEKESKNLPISNKVSKRELIEIETYRFLNKYGYDLDEKSDTEAVYTDTTAKEISRIVEYINTSEILN